MTMTDENTKPEADLIELTTDIVAAYVSNNPLPAGELPQLIADIHAAIAGVAAGAVPQQAEEKPVPAISVRKSVTPDFLICLEDGKKFKSLKRHLATHHGLTPEEYRQRWNLPADYPMVASNYSAARSAMAKSIGLGRKPAPAPEPAKPAAKTRGKKLGLTFS
jgi:predicted transcriptional regulator